MAETAPAAAPATPVKATRKRVAKPTKSGPGAAELITNALIGCKDRRGLSAVALKKILAAEGYEGKAFKRVILKMMEKKHVVQIKGTGACGSFKLDKPAVKPSKVANKPAAKKLAAKKPAAKKPAAATSKKVKKTPIKKPAAKSPKKKEVVKKEVVKKAATANKKLATPKKAVKAKAAKPAKKLVAKKPAKKTAAKKTAKTAAKKTAKK